jgi:hypothetical protein
MNTEHRRPSLGPTTHFAHGLHYRPAPLITASFVSFGESLVGFIVTGSSPDFSNFLQKHAVHRWAIRFGRANGLHNQKQGTLQFKRTLGVQETQMVDIEH